MGDAKTNGHDPATMRMVEILERIEAELRGLRQDTGDLRSEMAARFEALTKITGAAHRNIHERIDDAHGDAIATAEQLAGPEGVLNRLARLEAAVFKKTG